MLNLTGKIIESMSTIEPYFLEQSLGFHLGRTNRILANRIRKNFNSAGYDVTSEMWSVLVVISNNPGLTQQQLADITNRDKTTISRVVDRAIQKGYMESQPGPDRREKRITLTEAGIYIQEKLMRLASDTLEEALSGISESDVKKSIEILSRIYKNLDTPS